MPEPHVLDMPITRRRLLASAGTMAAILAAPGAARRAVGRASHASRPLFTLGVASGDPRPHGVVLWTRLAPDPIAGGGTADRAVPVRYEVARDPEMKRIVQRGERRALPGLAHSVHVELDGLQPGREYWYRFIAEGQDSPVGRAVTAPPLGRGGGELRFAFVSCQDWQNGYYTAYQALAQDDLRRCPRAPTRASTGGSPGATSRASTCSTHASTARTSPAATA